MIIIKIISQIIQTQRRAWIYKKELQSTKYGFHTVIR